MMKAVLGNHIVAQSDDITEAHGYSYFPSSSVRLDWLEKAPKTVDDLQCPHGVQFYDLILDGSAMSGPPGLIRSRNPKCSMSGAVSASGRTSQFRERAIAIKKFAQHGG
jgi:hypothetical protein